MTGNGAVRAVFEDSLHATGGHRPGAKGIQVKKAIFGLGIGLHDQEAIALIGGTHKLNGVVVAVLNVGRAFDLAVGVDDAEIVVIAGSAEGIRPLQHGGKKRGRRNVVVGIATVVWVKVMQDARLAARQVEADTAVVKEALPDARGPRRQISLVRGCREVQNTVFLDNLCNRLGNDAI